MTMKKYAITHHNLNGLSFGNEGCLDKTFHTHMTNSITEYEALKGIYPTLINHIVMDHPNLDLKSILHAIIEEFGLYLYIQEIKSND